mmetsp:Transcript_1070/g.3941  ORF Transcript_1070/g.3941 Transcript_1070/m.3941 type:complete len:198 (+) Transcript_1070:48-641(+)
MSRSPSCPNWYDQNAHLQERRKMITNIARLLQARKPNAPVEWMQKLPQMARRLEESLFRSAHSFDEYKDTATLKKRLQALAMAMGLRAQQQQAQQQAATADGAAAAAAAPSAAEIARLREPKRKFLPGVLRFLRGGAPSKTPAGTPASRPTPATPTATQTAATPAAAAPAVAAPAAKGARKKKVTKARRPPSETKSP